MIGSAWLVGPLALGIFDRIRHHRSREGCSTFSGTALYPRNVLRSRENGLVSSFKKGKNRKVLFRKSCFFAENSALETYLRVRVDYVLVFGILISAYPAQGNRILRTSPDTRSKSAKSFANRTCLLF